MGRGAPPHWGEVWGGGYVPFPEMFLVFLVENTVF